jgi:hypothetical protein
MKRGTALVLLLVILLAGLGVGIMAIQDRTDVGGPTYTVNQVAGGLRFQPRAWLGKTVKVTGVVSMNFLPCPSKSNSSRICDESYMLTEFPQGARSDSLILHPQPDRFLEQLRGLPGIGQFFPRPQPMVGVITLKVKLELASTSFLCSVGPCYCGEVSDAGPGPQMGEPLGLGQ